MHDGSMADADVVLDIQRLSVRRVEDRAVLNVYTMSDANRGDIASDHHVVHDRHLVAQHDVTSDVRCGRHKNVPAESWLYRWIIHADSFYELRDGNAKGAYLQSARAIVRVRVPCENRE